MPFYSIIWHLTWALWTRWTVDSMSITTKERGPLAQWSQKNQASKNHIARRESEFKPESLKTPCSNPKNMWQIQKLGICRRLCHHNKMKIQLIHLQALTSLKTLRSAICYRYVPAHNTLFRISFPFDWPTFSHYHFRVLDHLFLYSFPFMPHNGAETQPICNYPWHGTAWHSTDWVESSNQL